MADITSKVKEIIVEKLGADESEITPEASFTKLIMEFEKAFEIQIPEEEAQKIATVGDAVKYIEAQKK